MVKVINTKTGHNIKDRDEDWDIINSLETIFRKKRKYVIKMPKPGSPVIATLSGGLDSVANIVVLIEKFGLEVYPFFIKRNQSNLKWEIEATDYYNNLFKKRYPNLYHDVLKIDVETPGKAYKNMLRATKNLLDDLKLRKRNTYPARNPVMFLTGMEYGYALQSKGVFPKTLFVAEHSNDVSVHGSLTLMRIMNLLFCWLTNDWEWQFISTPIEKEFDNCYGKEVMVKYCAEHGVPLEQTRSCPNKDKIQCGKCEMNCFDRRMAFKLAGVEDKTKYQFSMPAKKPLK